MFQKSHLPIGIVKLGYYRHDKKREILYWNVPCDEFRRCKSEGLPSTVLVVESQVKTGDSGQQVIRRLKQSKEFQNYDLKIYYAVVVGCGIRMTGSVEAEHELDMVQLFRSPYNNEFCLNEEIHLPDYLAFVSEKVVVMPGSIP